MIEFEKPNIECLEVDDNNNYAKFVCEPLERGYGVTIGNSLRRILLSSLTGCALTSVKIEGVLHEFSSIPNVVEDVPEIIVNLKNVRLKFTENEEKVMRINFKGEGEVTAGDIITDGTVEILNPDLHIATVAEGGQLIMELTADMGRGYSPSEKNKKPNQDISVLPIDSIYTPVKKVNYQVKNTRVGQMVDYDKLIIEVWTDGSLKAHEALSLAAKVMTGLPRSFLGSAPQSVSGSFWKVVSLPLMWSLQKRQAMNAPSSRKSSGICITISVRTPEKPDICPACQRSKAMVSRRRPAA